MLEFIKDVDKVILVYTPEQIPSKFVYDELERSGTYTIAKVFDFSLEHLLSEINEDDEFDPIFFTVAIRDGDYYVFPQDILSTEKDVYVHSSIELSRKLFIAERGISIFKKIDKISASPIYIGGEHEGSIPSSDFNDIIKKFPNSYELDKYVSAKIEAITSSYIVSNDEYEEKYQGYLNKKWSVEGDDIIEKFSGYELFKYESMLLKLKWMLENEINYNEHHWQKEILDIILLLYPKYICVFDEAPVTDFHNKKERSIDYILVDSCGNIDIIEIKKPFDKCIVTKGQYRDNYIPLRDLSGTVMQIEKYIFHLNKSGGKGEAKLTKKYKGKLPVNISIQITNPSGIIIMGRKHNLNRDQLRDFEIIKRKYKNLIDIFTYDDLIERLEFIVSCWSSR